MNAFSYFGEFILYPHQIISLQELESENMEDLFLVKRCFNVAKELNVDSLVPIQSGRVVILHPQVCTGSGKHEDRSNQVRCAD
jgi:hypothetical protein